MRDFLTLAIIAPLQNGLARPPRSMESIMNARVFLSAAALPDSHQTKSVFGNKPTQTLVKEVVSFPPAPINTLVFEVAQQRLSAGKSVFFPVAEINKSSGGAGG